jgi:pimeloyl-ACP methyl ester carboxylesterase
VLRLRRQLDRLIDYVRDEAGVEISGRVLLFGFSRGAQAALRFSMLYPERVEAVAALSAGTYTLPLRSVTTPAGPAAAMMPFGVANLEELAGRGVDQLRMAGVRYLIEVGGSDNKDGDVPRQWDTFVGKNRVERATTYAAVLKDLGCETSLVVVPGAGHELNGAMMEQATSFLTVAAARAKPETTMLVSLSGLDLSGNHVE